MVVNEVGIVDAPPLSALLHPDVPLAVCPNLGGILAPCACHHRLLVLAANKLMLPSSQGIGRLDASCLVDLKPSMGVVPYFAPSAEVL